MNEKAERKDDLFLKVSIENIQGGIVAAMGLREYAVLQVIASYTNKEGKCYPNQDTLAEVCGVSKRQMIRFIDKLCEIRIDGKPILLRETKREGEKKTKNYYTVLPSSGMAFGDNKVVSNLSPRKKTDGGHCNDSSEGSDKTGKKVVTKSAKGSVKFVTLTKAIELNPLELNPLEQEGNAASLQTNKNDSLKDNNGIQIVVIEKDSISNQSDIVETESKRIAFSIVHLGRNKEEGVKGHTGTNKTSNQPTQGESLSKVTTPQETAATVEIKKPMTQRDSILLRKAENEKAIEREKAAALLAREERMKNPSEEMKGIAYWASQERR